MPDVTVRLRWNAELDEPRKTLSAQDAYVGAQQTQADLPVVTAQTLADFFAKVVQPKISTPTPGTR